MAKMNRKPLQATVKAGKIPPANLGLEQLEKAVPAIHAERAPDPVVQAPEAPRTLSVVEPPSPPPPQMAAEEDVMVDRTQQAEKDVEKPARLSIDLPPEMLAEFKIWCTRNKITMKKKVRALIIETIEGRHL